MWEHLISIAAYPGYRTLHEHRADTQIKTERTRRRADLRRINRRRLDAAGRTAPTGGR